MGRPAMAFGCPAKPIEVTVSGAVAAEAEAA